MKSFGHVLLLICLVTLATVVTAEQCGKNAGGAKCPDDLCCSQYGYCGSSPDYCGKGCDPNFGKCDSPSSEPAYCGVKNGTPCPTGECCSKDGVCGTTDEFCGDGCNLDYGRCKDTTTDGFCGVKNGKSCPSTQCCSQFGFCGYAEPFCDDGCDPKFGRCNGPGGAGLSPGAVHGTCKLDNTLAVTFDDGPGPFTEPLVQKIGDQKVTFFMNGNNIRCIYDLADVVLEAKSAGNLIGAHTWSHPKLSALSDKELRYQFLKLNEAFYKITGCRPKYMRPPFGDIDARGVEVARKLDMQVFIWDIDSTDSLPGTTLDSQKESISKSLQASPLPTPHIILSHDARQQTAEELSFFMLDKAKEGGWNQMPVGECYEDDPSNWYVCDRKPGKRDDTWKCDPSDRSMAEGGTLEFPESILILEGKANSYYEAEEMVKNGYFGKGKEGGKGKEDAKGKEDGKGKEDAKGKEDGKGKEDAKGKENGKGKEDAKGKENGKGKEDEDAKGKEDGKGKEDAKGKEGDGEVASVQLRRRARRH